MERGITTTGVVQSVAETEITVTVKLKADAIQRLELVAGEEITIALRKQTSV